MVGTRSVIFNINHQTSKVTHICPLHGRCCQRHFVHLVARENLFNDVIGIAHARAHHMTRTTQVKGCILIAQSSQIGIKSGFSGVAVSRNLLLGWVFFVTGRDSPCSRSKMSSEETEINTSGEPLQPSACTRGRPRARAGEKVGADISHWYWWRRFIPAACRNRTV